MRLATIATPEGPRLHVRGRSGYVDAAQATGDARLAGLQYVLAAGPAAAEVLRPLAEQDGRPVEDADFAPAVPAPARILCLGVNYSEHALEGGREVPSWPESFVRGADSVAKPPGPLREESPAEHHGGDRDAKRQQVCWARHHGSRRE